MKLTIVVPCYNEAENIPLILNRFSEVTRNNDIEVILVNNGSTDESADIINELLPEYDFASVVYVPVNQGYGYGILQGLKEARGDYIGWTHADMQTDPKDVVTAYNIIKKNDTHNLFLKGNRKQRPFVDMFFTMGMSVFETIYFRTPMYDINAQPNIFPNEFMRTWDNPPNDFAFDLYVFYMAKRKGLKIVRFPVLFPKRIYGKSKWNTEGLKSKKKFIVRTLAFSKELKMNIK